MIQGTTPTHTFKMPLDISNISKLRVSYAQNGQVVITKELSDFTVESDTITTKLTQEDTLKFRGGVDVQIQIRVLTSGGDSIASNVMRVSCGTILDRTVL